MTMKLSHNNTLQLPWRTISLSLCTLLLFLFLGAAPQSLTYSREFIIQGEIWRLITGHFVHCDLHHLVMNLAGLLLLGTLLEQHTGKTIFRVLALSCLGVSGWLWFAKMEITDYCGLSGVLNGLLVVLLATLWQKEKNPILLIIAIGSLMKIVIESAGQQSLFSNLSWTSIPGAHGAGMAAGIIYLLIIVALGACPRIDGS